MGSGNKEKRKRRAAGETVEPGEKPVKKGAEPPKAGVRFELEPDADRIFLDSMRQWDDRLAEFEDELAEVDPRTPKPRAGPVEVDLHRLRLEEAIWRVDGEIDAALASGRQTVLKIITGKGLHSGPGGGVLAREVHRHIAERYARHIQAMDESPSDVTVGGVPLRGHFTVTVKKS